MIELEGDKVTEETAVNLSGTVVKIMKKPWLAHMGYTELDVVPGKTIMIEVSLGPNGSVIFKKAPGRDNE